MPRRSELADAVAQRSSDVSLWGRRADERCTDEDLEVLAGLPIEKLALARQHITKLPRLPASVRKLWISECAALASLDGLEQLTQLQSLSLVDLDELDLARALALCAELPELTELRLGGIRSLPHAIANLPSVLSLTLEDCPALDWTPAFVALGRTPTLRTLKLVGAGRLADGALAALAQITELVVTRADGDMAPRSLGAMDALTRLALDDCGYEALPPTIGQLRTLEELVVERTPIMALPDELCDCAALRVLDLDSLTTLPAQLGRLAKLRELRISSFAKLRSLPDSIGDLAELRVLHIPWRKKLKIPDAIYRLHLEEFSGPDEVARKLTLRPPPTPEQDRVWIHDPDRVPADFGDPLELEVKLPQRAAPLPQLSKLRRLRELTIDTANLTDAFTRLAHAPHLRELRLEGDHATLPDALGELVQLTTLVIECGGPYADDPGPLTELPDAIGRLVGLESLTVTRHRLTRLPDAIGQLAALRELVLDGGAIKKLPDALGALQRLERFQLGTGAVERLPETLVQCRALSEIGISAWFEPCRIENLPLLGRVPGLKKLALRGMQIPLAKTIDALAGTGLEELDLTRCKLEALPASIGGLAKLRTLHLHGTKLERLPAKLRDCRELRWISVPFHSFDHAYRDKLKEQLPKGRWKKHFRSDTTWFERSD